MLYIKPKVGLMHIAYKPEQETAEIIKPFYDKIGYTLLKNNIEIIMPEKYVLDENDAIIQAKDFRNKDIDLFIMMIGTWTNANIALAALNILGRKDFVLYTYNNLGPGMKCNISQRTFGFTGAIEVKNSIDQMGLKDKYVFLTGSPDDPKLINKIIKLANVAAVKSKLKNDRIGLIGYYTMGMYSATFDPITIKEKFGISVEHLGENILINEINKINEKSAKNIAKNVMDRCTVVDIKKTGIKEFIENAKMYLAYKKLIDTYKLSAINTKCDPEMGIHYGRCSCLSHALLVDEGIMAACEGDIHQTIGMMILHYLSGKPVMFLDVVGACEENNSIQFISCGFAPTSIPKNSKDVKLYPQIKNSKGGGVTQAYTLQSGERVTIFRIDETYPRGNYFGHIISGTSSKSDKVLEEWPAAEVVLEGEGAWDHFTQNCTGDHFALVLGDYGEELKIFNKLMGFKTIITV